MFKKTHALKKNKMGGGKEGYMREPFHRSVVETTEKPPKRGKERIAGSHSGNLQELITLSAKGSGGPLKNFMGKSRAEGTPFDVLEQSVSQQHRLTRTEDGGRSQRKHGKGKVVLSQQGEMKREKQRKRGKETRGEEKSNNEHRL